MAAPAAAAVIATPAVTNTEKGADQPVAVVDDSASFLPETTPAGDAPVPTDTHFSGDRSTSSSSSGPSIMPGAVVVEGERKVETGLLEEGASPEMSPREEMAEVEVSSV